MPLLRLKGHYFAIATSAAMTGAVGGINAYWLTGCGVGRTQLARRRHGLAHLLVVVLFPNGLREALERRR